MQIKKTLFILFIFTYTIFSQSSSIIIAKVTKVVDGDTIYVFSSYDNLIKKVRLVGIDAPEMDQPYGIDSKIALENYISNKNIRIYDYGLDKYDRMLGKVIFNGKDINSLMIKNGHAWLYKKYKKSLNPYDQSYYSELENNAQNSKLGIFENPGFIEPWVWRRNKRIN